MARILVVSHEASRTGAPRVAVALAAGFVAAGHETHVVVRWPGPITPEFQATGATLHVEPLRRLRVNLRRFRRTRRFAVAVETFAARRVLRRVRPDVAWLNTALSACYAVPATEAGVAVVLHVHESEPFLSTVLGRYPLSGIWEHITLAGCSPAVAEALARVSGRAEADVATLYSSVDVPAVQAAGHRQAPVDSSPVQVVGACGRADVGKGFEDFLGVAAALAGENVRFVWIGLVDTDVGRAAHEQVGDLIERGALTLPGEVVEPYPEMAAVDVFVHAATNDSFPLVVLEAMALGKPVVAYALDGVREEVGDAGVLIGVGDVNAMVDAVRELLNDPIRRGRLGQMATSRVAQRFSVVTMQDSAVRLAQTADCTGGVNSSSSNPVQPINGS